MSFEVTEILMLSIYIAGMLVLIPAYRTEDQQKILLWNGVGALLFTLYFAIDGSWAPAVAVLAACIGSWLQLYFVKKGAISGDRRRIIVSTVFTLIGIACVYSGPPDAYIMIAVVASRFGELFDKARQIKLGYLLAEVLWFVYAAEMGMISVYWGCLAIALFLLYQVFRDYMREISVRASLPFVGFCVTPS